ncbi:MAG: thioredoxin [Clostridia bacterium]|nr:thioredoxin [Clostridia bacterium]
MAVIEVTAKTFEDEVLKSDKPVLVDFNAGWCGPCQALKPIIAEYAESHPGVKVVSVDIDEEDELSENYEVFSIPCLVVFRDGEEVNRQVGLISADSVADLVEA